MKAEHDRRKGLAEPHLDRHHTELLPYLKEKRDNMILQTMQVEVAQTGCAVPRVVLTAQGDRFVLQAQGRCKFLPPAESYQVHLDELFS